MGSRKIASMLRGAVLGRTVAHAASSAGTEAASSDGAAEGFMRVRPEDVAWQVDADSGMSRAVISGDPSQPGLYVIRVKFPRGVMSRNHYHREDRHATVIEGTWWTGTGDEFAPEKTVPLKAGAYMKHPAGAHHFDGAKDEDVIVQIIGEGPSETTRLRPEEGSTGPSLPA